MTANLLTEIIELIEIALRSWLDDYNCDADDINGLPIKSLLGKAKINLYNERSIAYHFNKAIQFYLRRFRIIHYYVSEARIEYAATPTERKKAKSELHDMVGKQAKKVLAKVQDVFIPDALIIVPYSSVVPVYCIEYKVSNRFEYLKLASDFLKYKYYSQAFGCESAFVYILFFKGDFENILELKGTQELSKHLYNVPDFKEKSLFYYLSMKGKVVPETDNATLLRAVYIADVILYYIDEYDGASLVDNVSRMRECAKGMWIWVRALIGLLNELPLNDEHPDIVLDEYGADVALNKDVQLKILHRVLVWLA